MMSSLSPTPFQTCFVLVHGAFRGGWSWRKVRRILQSRGYEVFTPSLTGAGDRIHLLSPEIDLETYVKDISNLLYYEDLTDVVLVGHSQGGIITQAVAQRIPERIAHLVYLDAPVLENGQCALDVLPPETLAYFELPQRDHLIPATPLSASEYFLISEIHWINERLTSTPANPGLDRVILSADLDIPQSYVFCARTPPFYPASYTRQRFDREGIPYKLLDAPHDCLMSHPALVAELLESLTC